MKKILCLIVTLMLLQSGIVRAEETPAATETPEAETGTLLGFDAGFALRLPDGWKCYEPDEEMQRNDILYCLSNADGTCWLYIQQWSSNCADIESLKTEIAQKAEPRTSGVYTYNGVDFVVYDLDEGDVSCCATLLNGEVINFAFTPQSDRDYMLTAIDIIGSFAWIETET